MKRYQQRSKFTCRLRFRLQHTFPGRVYGYTKILRQGRGYTCLAWYACLDGMIIGDKAGYLTGKLWITSQVITYLRLLSSTHFIYVLSSNAQYGFFLLSIHSQTLFLAQVHAEATLKP